MVCHVMICFESTGTLFMLKHEMHLRTFGAAMSSSFQYNVKACYQVFLPSTRNLFLD